MTAYIIARIEVTDPQDYATYAGQTVALAEAAGGTFLVRAITAAPNPRTAAAALKAALPR